MADLSELLDPIPAPDIEFNTYDEIFASLLRNEKVFLAPLSRLHIKKLRTALLTRIKEYNKLQLVYGAPELKKVVSISLTFGKDKMIIQLLEQKPVAEGIMIIKELSTEALSEKDADELHEFSITPSIHG